MAHYAFDNSWREARRRLALLEDALDQATFRRLKALGMAEGWYCLEVGAGGGSVCEWLCAQVGSQGHVLATDLDTRFLEPLTQPNLTVQRHNILTDGLPEATFDLIHTRWVLMHLVQRDQVLPRLVAALKPGGWLVLEEADTFPLAPTSTGPCARVWEVFIRLVEAAGASGTWARGLPTYLQQHGLVDLGAEGTVQLFSGGSPLAEFWQLSWSQLSDPLLSAGLGEDEFTAAKALLEDPHQWFTGPATVTAWGRKPGA
jgi:SAM-dependent methyltransferase